MLLLRVAHVSACCSSPGVVELPRLILYPAIKLVDRDHLRAELELQVGIVLLFGQLKLEDLDLGGAVDLFVLHPVEVTIIRLEQLLLKGLQGLRLAEFSIALRYHTGSLLCEVDQLVVLE